MLTDIICFLFKYTNTPCWWCECVHFLLVEVSSIVGHCHTRFSCFFFSNNFHYGNQRNVGKSEMIGVVFIRVLWYLYLVYNFFCDNFERSRCLVIEQRSIWMIYRVYERVVGQLFKWDGNRIQFGHRGWSWPSSDRHHNPVSAAWIHGVKGTCAYTQP